MTEFIENLFSTIFGDHVIIATILIAIVPIIEIKGAIPFAMSKSIWGSVALGSVKALLFSLLGSSLIVPILALIYIPIINALKRTKLFKNIANKIELKVNRSKNKIESKAEKSNLNEPNEGAVKSVEISKTEKEKQETKETENNNSTTENIEVTANKKYNKAFFIKLFCVFLFVSVPLPLTGVWTGTCVAVVLGLGFWWSCLAVICGNIVSGVLVSLISSIPGFDSIYIVYAVLAFILLVIIYSVIKKVVTSKKESKE